MPINKIRAFSNCDEVTIVWQTDAPIAGCRGFALERGKKGNSTTSFLPTWVGFKGEKHKPGEKRPSTVWPIQRYIWSDYEVHSGDEVRYRAIPMIGTAGNLHKAPQSEWSAWTPWLTAGTRQTPNFEAYFNRGIVASQWLARQHPTKKSLQSDIGTKGSKNRTFLSGPLRVALLDRLEKARTDGVEIYAALYELNDPDLIDALKAIGPKVNLILGSGAYKSGEPDENADVRKDLRLHSSIQLHDRLVKSPHFAHNKFVVFCDKHGDAADVWTGSTNWTETGLCTQVNNGILISSPEIADAYHRRWTDLKDAGNDYPASLSTNPSTKKKSAVGNATVTAWNVPISKLADLVEAKKRIAAATDGVLFLMFNPGPKNTLLNTIVELDPEQLFIHGIVNQDPGGNKAPVIKFTHKGKELPARKLAAILPAALKKSGTWFDKTFTFNRVMIHSKVVVIDPFGKKPVVITGSHNLGPKASGKNDDNFVIIENAPGLAAEYAVNVLGVYGRFKWLYNLSLAQKGTPKNAKKSTPQYDGNWDDDLWQQGYTKGVNLREIEFWLG